MTSDRDHFSDYREQTRIKHEILEKYLKSYFWVLNKHNNNLIFIDGFAGRGTYDHGETTCPGSPIRALELIASDAKFRDCVSTIFIEKDCLLFEDLNKTVQEFYRNHPEIREPHLLNCEFQSGLNEILSPIEQSGKQLAPTFLFVDPCGVSGVCFETMTRLMQFDKSEIFLFFNIDGIRRILGLGKSRGSTLETFFGSDDDVDKIIENTDGMLPERRERFIVSRYYDIFQRKTGAKYMATFRIEKENQRTVSHYLIHITKNDLGFRIMKDIMWKVGKTETGRGGLALMQKSIQNGYMLFDSDWDRFKVSILQELTQPRKVTYFYKSLPSQPENAFCEAAYREALLELEKEGKILVFNPQGASTDATTRPKRKGRPTLGEAYTIQLRGIDS
jgi:three-Cys-motif partner protein